MCWLKDLVKIHYKLTFANNILEKINLKRLTTPLWDCNGTRTHNYLVCKRTLNHLANLAKWLSCVVSTSLYGTFDCMFLSCHMRVSEWIHTLYLPECQGTPCLKQARYLKFKWHSGKYRVCIHSEMRTWHDKNIEHTVPLYDFSKSKSIHANCNGNARDEKY